MTGRPASGRGGYEPRGQSRRWSARRDSRRGSRGREGRRGSGSGSGRKKERRAALRRGPSAASCLPAALPPSWRSRNPPRVRRRPRPHTAAAQPDADPELPTRRGDIAGLCSLLHARGTRAPPGRKKALHARLDDRRGSHVRPPLPPTAPGGPARGGAGPAPARARRARHCVPSARAQTAATAGASPAPDTCARIVCGVSDARMGEWRYA